MRQQTARQDHCQVLLITPLSGPLAAGTEPGALWGHRTPLCLGLTQTQTSGISPAQPAPTSLFHQTLPETPAKCGQLVAVVLQTIPVLNRPLPDIFSAFWPIGFVLHSRPRPRPTFDVDLSVPQALRGSQQQQPASGGPPLWPRPVNTLVPKKEGPVQSSVPFPPSNTASTSAH
jgi:hypothetical protein